MTDARELRRRINQVDRAALAANRRALGKDALLLQGSIRKTLSTPGRGRVYRRGKVTHRASLAGEPPAVDRGQLRAGVAIQPQGEDQLRVGPTAVYAAALEYGTVPNTRSVRFRKGPQLNRKRLAATLRRAGARSLAASVQARGPGRIFPRPYMKRSLDAVAGQMAVAHIHEVRAAVLLAAQGGA